jgi:predicted deacylase
MSPTQHQVEVVPVCTLSNGHTMAVALHWFRGSGNGPTLGVLAGSHGDEPLGIEISRQLCLRVGPSSFRGTLVVLPLANPYGFQALTRNTPLDMGNLNRVFPGDSDGMLTEQLAAVISARFVQACDVVVDLHSGGVFPVVDYAYIGDDSDLPLSFGTDLLYHHYGPPGSLSEYARGLGKQWVVAELGGGGLANERFVNRGLRGVSNIMKRVGMVDGEPDLPAEQLVVEETRILRPHHGGILDSALVLEHLGTNVPRGTRLGTIYNSLTFEELEVIEAPFEQSAMILLRQSVTKVDPGDFAYIVGDATHGRRVARGARWPSTDG